MVLLRTTVPFLRLRSAMGVLVLALLAATVSFAADEQQIALMLKAQSDFDRVQLAVSPPLRDTAACIQTQAALMTVASRKTCPWCISARAIAPWPGRH